jgi:hypothetical protein
LFKPTCRFAGVGLLESLAAVEVVDVVVVDVEPAAVLLAVPDAGCGVNESRSTSSSAH